MRYNERLSRSLSTRKLSYTLTASFGDGANRLKSTFSTESDTVYADQYYILYYIPPAAHGDIDA